VTFEDCGQEGQSRAQQDLSDLFVARVIEQFLTVGGRFSFIMPAAVLTRGQFAGFRAASWPIGGGGAVAVSFDRSWDLSMVYPYFFPRTCAVVHGQRVLDGSCLPLSRDLEAWRGSIRDVQSPWVKVEPQLSRAAAQVTPREQVVGGSPYRARFTNGATIFPRVLTTVVLANTSPVGTGAGRRAVRSSRGTYENAPWKTIDDLEGVVEQQFIHPLVLGENVLPFRLTPPTHAILPITSSGRLVDPASYPGLDHWWSRASRLSEQYRTSSMSLADNVNYRRKLTDQFPLPPQRVVVAHSAMHVTACRLTEASVIEHQLDWGAVQTADEGFYLCAVLNSPAVTEAATPHMTSGKGGGRHIGKSLWNVPIPLFDPFDRRHAELAQLGQEAEEAAALVVLPSAPHGTLRRKLRASLAATGITARIDALVTTLLDSCEI
jgi:hypothetical protein